MLNAILVFLATATADVFWTKYMLEVAEKRAAWAALWSAGIIGLGAFTVVSYTHDARMLVPAMAGAFVGTFLTVRRAAK